MIMWKKIVLFLFLLGIFICAVHMRRQVYQYQFDRHQIEGRLPFTLESALQYRMTRTVWDTGRLASCDEKINVPAGLHVYQTYSLGAEWIYTAMGKCLPSCISVPERIRWAALLWFCLGVPCLYFIVRIMTGSYAGGLLAALYYAVSTAAVLRSTGQELSRENAALPVLLFHLWMFMKARRTEGHARWLWAGFSGLSLLVAWCLWDLIQFYLMLWTMRGCWSLVRKERSSLRCYLLEGGLVFVGTMINPYLRAHAAYSSLFVLVWAVCALWTILDGLERQRLRWVIRCIGAALLCSCWFWLHHDVYQHFGSLLWAKIRFMNVKPSDPARLHFTQRIMWTPALHSANSAMIGALFPLWPVLCGLGGLFCWRRFRREWTESGFVLLGFFVSALGFVFFARLHVYAAWYAALVIGMTAAWMARSWGGWRWLGWAAMLCLCFVEGTHTYRNRALWGRSGVYNRESQQLFDAIRKLEPGTVLANFGISAEIRAYADVPVVLHPKFEEAGIRTRVQEYMECLFKGDEQAFRDLADKWAVRYVVYSKGEFATVHPELQQRYMVDALIPGPTAPAVLFEGDEVALQYFSLLFENRKYKLYRVLSRGDEQWASERAQQAWECLCSGHFSRAEIAASEALVINDKNTQAKKVLMHLTSLRAQGVELE